MCLPIKNELSLSRITRITYCISYCLFVVTLAMTCDVNYITIVYLHRNLTVTVASNYIILMLFKDPH